MAVITMGVLVALPTKFGSVGADPYALGAAETATRTPIEVAISPARIELPEEIGRASCRERV
jgi:hypothetical protein